MEKLDIKELLKLDLTEREIAIYNHLRQIDCGEHIEKLTQNNITLSYLSWTWAVDTLNNILPFTYKVKMFDDGNGKQVPYSFDENTGYMVFTSVNILGIEKEMWLPVMDSNNRAMKAEPYTLQFKSGSRTIASATMFDVNKTLMRCLVKNLAMFGLGAYIYAGEDLPIKEKEYITDEQLKEMENLGVKFDGVLKSYNITNILDLEKSQAEFVINAKRSYLEKQKAKEKGADNGNKA